MNIKSLTKSSFECTDVTGKEWQSVIFRQLEDLKLKLFQILDYINSLYNMRG